jgi:hypothetical protein
VTHRAERVPPPFDGMALAAVAPLHRVDLRNSAADRQPRAGVGKADRPAAGPARFRCGGQRLYKDLTVPPGIL